VHLSNLRTVDFFTNFWGPKLICHTFVSFDFGPEGYVCISIETRTAKGQTYSAIAGLYRQYVEIGFAEVFEVSEVVDHDAVTVNFDVGRLGRVLEGGIVSSQTATSAMAPRNPDLRPPARSARTRALRSHTAANAAAKGTAQRRERKIEPKCAKGPSTPTSKINVTTPKRNNRTKKRHTWMRRDFEGAEEFRFLLRDM
jgi:hypothetical protein